MAKIKEQLKALYELQKVEQKCEMLEQSIKCSPEIAQLKKYKRAITSLENKICERNKLHGKLKHDLMRIEQKIKESDAEIRKLEHRIYSGEVTTIKELEILQKKQENARRTLELCEEKAIEIMVELDSIKSELAQDEKVLDKKNKEYIKIQLKINSNIDKIKKELELLYQQKKDLRGNIALELLDKYERIKKSKKNPVAIIVDGKCSGCMMDVSIMIAAEVTRHKSLITCENCGRILI